MAEADRHYGPSSALIMLDLDHFKEVNDQYGHLAGDQTLVQFVQLIRGCLRQMDFLSRFGGEEFLILLPEATLAQAQSVAERIRKSCEERRLVCEGTSLSVTTSVGVALQNHKDESLSDLIEHVDRALYQAKHQGRNQVVVHQNQPN